MRFRKQLKNAVLLIVLIVGVIKALFPFIWNIGASLKPTQELATPSLFPSRPTLNNYRDFFARGRILTATRNSFLVACFTGLVSIWFGFLAAYGLVRFRLKGRTLLFQTIIGSQFIPLSSIIVPFYILIYRLKLLDSLIGLVIVYLVYCLPFAVWLLMGFIQKIPKEIEEAALLDGCSRLGAIFRVVLPLLKAGLFTTFSFVWIKAWQEYLAAVMLTSTDKARTLPVVLASLQSEVSFQYGVMMAGVVIAQLPPLFAFLILNRWFLGIGARQI